MSTKLDSPRLRMLNEVLFALYDDLTVPVSFQQVVEMLAKIVPAISFSAVEIHHNPRRFTTRAEHNWDQNFSARIARVGARHPVVMEIQKNGFRPVVRLSDLCTMREFRQTEVFCEVYKLLSGFRDHAGMLIQLSNSQVGISLNRDTIFQDEDVLMLELLHPHLQRILQRAFRYTNLAADDPLTPREREVLHWVVEGKRDSEIAIILQMSPRTVGQHVRVILRKLNVETRTAAAAAVWRARSGTILGGQEE